MACGYWKAGASEREAVFHLTFRRPPFGGGYAIAAGIAPALDYLRQLRFTCTVDAVREGSLVFPHEPIVRVRGPIAQGQLVETALLTLINFQTLIATKAARICQAARGAPVLEFGLRRAQGVDG